MSEWHDERERCPLCGTPWTLEGGQVHMMGGLYCVRSQLTQAKKQLQQALAREARLRRVVEAAIAARDAFRLYDNPEKWHKAIAKLAKVVEDLDPKLVVDLDREEGRECDS